MFLVFAVRVGPVWLILLQIYDAV
ncbi:uncharacterized protein METZ01_LOCUS367755 [marine metagenome]|uniref:Uncharacterized protein n=1 Tax=marine metagenome TaxID=408172 RepID=A0A382T0Y8_9ZZZZ